MKQTTARIVRKSLSSVDLLEMSFDLPEERQLSPPHTMSKQIMEIAFQKNQVGDGEFHGYLPWVPSLPKKDQSCCLRKDFPKPSKLSVNKASTAKYNSEQLVANSSLQHVLMLEESNPNQFQGSGVEEAVTSLLSPKSHPLKAETSGGTCGLPDSTSTDFSSQSHSPGRLVHRKQTEKLSKLTAQPLKVAVTGVGLPQLQTPYKMMQTKSEHTQLSTAINFGKQPLQIVNFPVDTRESLHSSSSPPSQLWIPSSPKHANQFDASRLLRSPAHISSPKDFLWNLKSKTPNRVVQEGVGAVESKNQLKVINMNKELAQFVPVKHMQSKLKVKSQNSDNKLGVPESILRDIQTKRSEFYSMYKKLPIRRAGFRSLVPEPSTDTQGSREQFSEVDRRGSHTLQLPEIRPMKPAATPYDMLSFQQPVSIPADLPSKVPKGGACSGREISIANKLLQSRRSHPALTAAQKAKEGYPSEVYEERQDQLGAVQNIEAKAQAPNIQYGRFPGRGLLGSLHRDELQKFGL